MSINSSNLYVLNFLKTKSEITYFFTKLYQIYFIFIRGSSSSLLSSYQSIKTFEMHCKDYDTASILYNILLQ